MNIFEAKQEEKEEEFDFPEINNPSPTDADEISDDASANNTSNNNNNVSYCKALVKRDKFEGSTSSDDFEDYANETIALMKETKWKWEQCGMVDVLETFDLDQIKKKVIPWIEKNKEQNSYQVDNSNNSTSIDEHIVHIEEHHHRQIHVASDDDSLHSLDTANYIRSSRKKKTSSCTTTTIKKFSFVKGSRRQLQKKYSLSDLDLRFPNCEIRKVPPKERSKSTNSIEPTSDPAQRQRSRREKRRSDVFKRSLSICSSSSDSIPYYRTPKFKRRSVKNCSKKEEKPHLKLPKTEAKTRASEVVNLISTTEASETDLELCEKKLPPSSVIPDIEATTSCNETGFAETSLINSTALPKTNQPLLPNPTRKCLITPIKNKPEQKHRIKAPEARSKLSTPQIQPTIHPVNATSGSGRPSTRPMKPPKIRVSEVQTKKGAESSDVQVPEDTHKVPEASSKQFNEDKSKILLYCPTNLESHKENLNGKRFHLTREYFYETVGKKNSRRFIKLNSKKFPFQFDRESTIYFKIPEESEESASSDEDVLYMFGREGKLIVEDYANETIALMKETKWKWEQCGMVDVLETFDLDQIKKKIIPWIEKNKEQNSYQVDNSNNSTSIDEHIVHIEEHHHRQIHVASDDDSLHSLDTANYIRSSRKKKTSSCTTTTIKKFSFVKGSRRQLQKKYSLSDLDLRFPNCEIRKVPPKERSKSTNSIEPTSDPAQRQRSRREKRRSDVFKRSLSICSSSSDSIPYYRTPKFKRRSVKNCSKKEEKPHLKLPKTEAKTRASEVVNLISTTEASETDLELCEKKLPPSSVIPDIEATTSCNETGFAETSLINSTALPKTNQPLLPNPTRKCLITPIKNKPEQKHRIKAPEARSKLSTPQIQPTIHPVNATSGSGRPSTRPMKPPKIRVSEVQTKKGAESSDVQVPEDTHKVPEASNKQFNEDKSKILLYCPTNLESHKENLNGKRFHLTREYFYETVGKKNSRRFIKLNSKKFPFQFDRESTIYFKIPEESEESASSDEDVLYMFGREGKLIVEPAECIKK